MMKTQWEVEVVLLEVGIIPLQLGANFGLRLCLLFAGLSVFVVAAGVVRAVTVIIVVVQLLTFLILFNLLEGKLKLRRLIKRLKIIKKSESLHPVG